MGDVQHPLVLIRDEALARSCGPAPITAVASASISCWSTHSRLARMVSVISPALSAASSSDRSDSLRATGTRLLREPWQEHVETHAGGPPNGWTLTPTYTTSRDTNGGQGPRSSGGGSDPVAAGPWPHGGGVPASDVAGG